MKRKNAKALHGESCVVINKERSHPQKYYSLRTIEQEVDKIMYHP
jgi:hypothetical protein